MHYKNVEYKGFLMSVCIGMLWGAFLYSFLTWLFYKPNLLIVVTSTIFGILHAAYFSWWLKGYVKKSTPKSYLPLEIGSYIDGMVRSGPIRVERIPTENPTMPNWDIKRIE